MRFFVSSLVTLAMLVTASAASAVNFTLTGLTTSLGSPVTALLPGETLTIGIRIDNVGGDPVFGLGALVHGYDENVLAPGSQRLLNCYTQTQTGTFKPSAEGHDTTRSRLRTWI